MFEHSAIYNNLIETKFKMSNEIRELNRKERKGIPLSNEELEKREDLIKRVEKIDVAIMGFEKEIESLKNLDNENSKDEEPLEVTEFITKMDLQTQNQQGK